MEEIEQLLSLRAQGGATIEQRLATSAWLVGEAFSAADVVVFPGIQDAAAEPGTARGARAADTLPSGRGSPPAIAAWIGRVQSLPVRKDSAAALEGVTQDRKLRPVFPFRMSTAMPDFPVRVQFPGRLVFVGFGSIGQGVLPLVLRHIGIKPERITIVTADEAGKREAAEYGIKFVVNRSMRQLPPGTDPLLGKGDFLLNLPVDVSSIALIKFAHEKGALYLDTCIEPWPGGYTDPSILARRTIHALREEALALRQSHPNGPTAVLTGRGANPGMWCRTSSSRRC